MTVVSDVRLTMVCRSAAARARRKRMAAFIDNDFEISLLGPPAEGSYVRISPAGEITLHKSRRDRVGKPAGTVSMLEGAAA